MMKKTMVFSEAAAAAEGDSSSSTAWSPVPVTPPRPLDLALSPASLRAIASAEVAFDQLVDEHEVMTVIVVGGGGGGSVDADADARAVVAAIGVVVSLLMETFFFVKRIVFYIWTCCSCLERNKTAHQCMSVRFCWRTLEPSD